MNPTIAIKLEEYKNWLIANNLKPNSVKMYKMYARMFFEAVDINDLSELTTAKIMEVFAKEKEKPKHGQSRANSMIQALKHFCIVNKITGLEFPKTKVNVSKRVKQPITQKELEKLIIPYIPDIWYNDPLKYKALIYFMYYTGLREKEIVKLERSAIDLTKDEVIVYLDKQSIHRSVPLVENLKIILEKYFLQDPEVTNAFNTSVAKIRRIAFKIKDEKLLGDRHIWPHLLRDSYACMSLEAGMDIHELQMLMGHKNIKTTLQYIPMCSDRVKQKFLRLIKGVL
jgi:site-specific recombinase XerD